MEPGCTNLSLPRFCLTEISGPYASCFLLKYGMEGFLMNLVATPPTLRPVPSRVSPITPLRDEEHRSTSSQPRTIVAGKSGNVFGLNAASRGGIYDNANSSWYCPLGCRGWFDSFSRHPGGAKLLYVSWQAPHHLPGDPHESKRGGGSEESGPRGLLPVNSIFAWTNARVGRSVVTAVRSVCNRLRLIRRTAWYGTSSLTGMKGRGVCIATSPLDRSSTSVTPRLLWGLIARRWSGTTSNPSSFRSYFQPVSPFAGVAMSLRRSARNSPSWLCIANVDAWWKAKI